MYLICLLFLLNSCTNVFTKENVLLLIVDDLRTNLGVYGYQNSFTPNLDKLASRSFVFKNAFCQQSLCAPSRNSFLTSRRPDSLKLYDFYNYWRDTVGNFTTIPQYFKENGYYTHSIGKVFHPGISSNFSDDMPYSWSDKPFHPKSEIYKNAKVCLNSDGSLGKNLICPVDVKYQPGGTLPDIESTEAALNFFKYEKNITNGHPFFLAVGFHKPHVPLKFPQEFLDYHPLYKVKLPTNRWRSYSLPYVAWNPWNDIRNRDDVNKLNISFPFGVIPDNFIKKIIQNYNAAATYVDSLIGMILEKVDQSNTIIVLASDHGWSIGEHGEYSKYSNFDVATRVPLMIHVPKLSTSEVIIEQIVELVDLFPTLRDITQIGDSLPICDRKGINKKLCTEGKSLVPTMVNAKQKKMSIAKRAVFSQFPRPGNYPTKKPDSDKPKKKDIRIMGYSMRTERYRYTEWVEFNNTICKPNWTNVFGIELYDHLIDPEENMNLIDRNQLINTSKELRKQLILGWRYA